MAVESSHRPGAPPTALRLLAALCVFLLTAGLFIGGAAPVAVGLFKPPWDKLAHVLTFAVMGAGFGLASGARGWRMLAVVLGGAMAVGAIDELHQLWLPGRDAGLDDFAADAAGGLLGALLLSGAYRWLDRQRGRQARLRQSSESSAVNAVNAVNEANEINKINKINKVNKCDENNKRNANNKRSERSKTRKAAAS